MTFSEKLTTLRAGRGWSQERLAQELGVTRQAVGRWERGSGLPDANSLMALARVFDVDAEWLLDDGAEEAEPRRGVRSRFTMTDRAWAAILAAGALYSAAYSAVVLHDMEGLAQLLLSGGHTYMLIMTIQYFNLAVFGPWTYFALGHTAAALFCRFAVTPGRAAQVWLRRMSCLLFAVYALMFALSIILRVTEFEYGGALHMFYNFLVGNSGYMFVAGVLFSLSRIRPRAV